jgi:hypothetical protein
MQHIVKINAANREINAAHGRGPGQSGRPAV